MSRRSKPKHADEEPGVTLQHLDGASIPAGMEGDLRALIERYLSITKKHEDKVSEKTLRRIVVASLVQLPKVRKKRRSAPRTPPWWQETFLDWLRSGQSINLAAELTGIHRMSVYRHRKRDKAFARRWDEAISQQTNGDPHE